MRRGTRLVSVHSLFFILLIIWWWRRGARWSGAAWALRWLLITSRVIIIILIVFFFLGAVLCLFLTLQQLLLDQREKLRGLRIVWFVDENWNEERGGTIGWFIDWQDLQLMDAGYILIWHSLLASWMSLSITALRNWNHTSSFQRPFLPFKYSLNTFTENGTLTKSIKNIWRIWTKQTLKCGITEDDRSLYLNYQLQWCLNVFSLNILLLSLFFLPICLTRGMRLSCEGSMCRSSWQPLSSPWSSLLSTKLTVQVSLLLVSVFAFCATAYLLLLSLGAVLSFPAPQQAPQSTVLLLQLWNHI